MIEKGKLTPVNNTHHYNPADNYYLSYNKYNEFFGVPPKERITNFGNEEQYIRLSYQEIVKLFLRDNHNSGYYVRDTDLKVPFDWVRTNYKTVADKLNFIS